MSDNYIVINGKRTELTEKQLKALGVEPEKPINPFNRTMLGSHYYIPYLDGKTRVYTDDNNVQTDLMRRNCCYINDKQFAEQVALHQLLYRKLLKFAYDNGCEDTQEWDNNNVHCYIYYDHSHARFDVDCTVMYASSAVWFPSKQAAEQAIKEVVEPFMKEHPEFVW